MKVTLGRKTWGEVSEKRSEMVDFVKGDPAKKWKFKRSILSL